MIVRSVDQWEEILRPFLRQLPPKLGANLAGLRILGDLTHYANGRSYEADDASQIGNAMTAWAKLTGGN